MLLYINSTLLFMVATLTGDSIEQPLARSVGERPLAQEEESEVCQAKGLEPSQQAAADRHYHR